MMGGWGQGGRAEVSAWRWRAERVQGELGIFFCPAQNLTAKPARARTVGVSIQRVSDVTEDTRTARGWWVCVGDVKNHLCRHVAGEPGNHAECVIQRGRGCKRDK